MATSTPAFSLPALTMPTVSWLVRSVRKGDGDSDARFLAAGSEKAHGFVAREVGRGPCAGSGDAAFRNRPEVPADRPRRGSGRLPRPKWTGTARVAFARYSLVRAE